MHFTQLRLLHLVLSSTIGKEVCNEVDSGVGWDGTVDKSVDKEVGGEIDIGVGVDRETDDENKTEDGNEEEMEDMSGSGRWTMLLANLDSLSIST